MSVGRPAAIESQTVGTGRIGSEDTHLWEGATLAPTHALPTDAEFCK